MNRLILIIALLCLPSLANIILACQCREYGTPICAEFWRSDAVFVGQVVDIQPLKKKPDDVYTYLMVRFMVKESFRGVSGRRVSVATATTMCDTKFKQGKQYLVYASLDDTTNQLFTGMCRGTTLAVDIDDSLKELRKLARREIDSSISGRIKTDRYEGLPGITVELKGSDKTFKTMTTKYGKFSFASLAPGSFRVRVSVPYAVRLVDSSNDASIKATQSQSGSTFEYEVTLQMSECSYLELDVDGTDPRATAIVAGNVQTTTGQGVERGAVFLINDLDTAPDYVAFLKDGSFSFEKIVPGEYYLVLNGKSDVPEEYDAPYARTYYPATEDKREAKKIQITEGAIIENLVMRLGARLPERSAAGYVVWKSGRSVDGAHIAVYSGEEYVRYVSIDHDGRFNCTLYGDYDYSIEALEYVDGVEFRSQRMKIPRGNTAGLKLVIQRVKR